MFKCEKCGRTSLVGEKENKVVILTRERTYYNIIVLDFLTKNKKYYQYFVKDIKILEELKEKGSKILKDYFSKGKEIVKEEIRCNNCK